MKKVPQKYPKWYLEIVTYLFYYMFLVEAAGVEPASENLPLELLRA